MIENYVLKRDGRTEKFDKEKIEEAIKKAFLAVDGSSNEYSVNKAKNIADFIESKILEESLSVEQIQDLVENGLMSTKRKDVARAYILYRNERTIERERNSNLIKTISEKISASNVQNQNANIDEHSFGGRMGEANGAVMRKFALDYCMSTKAKNNHLNNRIYTHDLDHYAVGDHNCLTLPFDDLLANGFNTRQTDVRPAQSVSTAFQLVAVIFQLQSLQQYGGVSASHLDWTMIPYVRKSFYKHFIDGLKYIEENEYALGCDLDAENLSIESDLYKKYEKVYKYATDKITKEVYQSVEALYHNLNVLGRLNSNIKNIAI